MNNPLKMALISSASFLSLASGALAQDGPFSWEGEVEIGFESVFDSNIPGNEGKDPFLTFELSGEVALSEFVSIFGGLTIEEMTGPSNSVEDLGLYIHELGLQFANDAMTVQLGKVSPAFGAAWDGAAGYFASALAEDYELTEQLGATAEFAVGENGALSVALFYADNTSLSRSMGFNRGKTRTSMGGAGNTGKINNGAIQWTQEFGSTYYLVGARHLSKGTGDAKDETGFVAGIGHSFADSGTPLELFAEVATFDGFGGTTDDAQYATLSAAYTVGNTTYSGAFSHRDVESVGRTNLFSIGIDHEFENGIAIGGALGHADDAGADENIFGVSMIIPLGG